MLILPFEADKSTIICLIEAPGAIARSNLIPWSKSRGSEHSNAGFELKIGQLLGKIGLFYSIIMILEPPPQKKKKKYGSTSIKTTVFIRWFKALWYHNKSNNILL